MPDLHAILGLYRERAAAAVSGATSSESAIVTGGALDRVCLSFLSAEEFRDWNDLAETARVARTRMGRQRFHRWEMGNPDIVSLLRRKARVSALG